MLVDPEFLKEFDHLMAKADRSNAIAFVQSKIKDAPESIVYREHLGIAYWVSGDCHSAFQTFEETRQMGELSDIGELIFIHTQVTYGKRRRARQVLVDFLLKRNVAKEHLERLASKFGKLGEFSLALTVCQFLVSRYPHNADAWYGIGFYQERLGVSNHLLVKPFRMAATLSQSIGAKVHLAKLLCDVDRIDEAHLIISKIPLAHFRRRWWVSTAKQIAELVGDAQLLKQLSSIEF